MGCSASIDSTGKENPFVLPNQYKKKQNEKTLRTQSAVVTADFHWSPYGRECARIVISKDIAIDNDWSNTTLLLNCFEKEEYLPEIKSLLER